MTTDTDAERDESEVDANDAAPERIGSGIDGLDEVLRGGLVNSRLYLVCGAPGTGKTLLGMHFLEAGLERGETVLFVHGEESREEIVTNGSRLGIDVEDAAFLDLGPESEFFTEDRSYELVDPGTVDHDRYTKDIHEAISRIDPSRVVIDPITQLRYIEPNDHQFRKRILSLMRFLKERNATVLTTATVSNDGAASSEEGGTEYDVEVQSLSDSVIELRRGDGGRRLRVTKHRGYGQRRGSHGMAIRDGGVEVFPALVSDRERRGKSSVDEPGVGVEAETETETETETGVGCDPGILQSGNPALDELLGGGLERGTVTFVSGPTGAGKTTLSTQFLVEAATEGSDAALYLFEESVETFVRRADSVGVPIEAYRGNGTLSIEPVEPLSRSAEEFAHQVRDHVDDGIEVVLIDGIDGYTMSLQGRRERLVRKLRALTRYLTDRGVTVLITDEIRQLSGVTTATSANLSHLADNIVFVSYLEVDGGLEKVIGVLKKRTGGFEHTMRRFEITSDGLRIGDPVPGYTGVFDGRTGGQSGPSRPVDDQGDLDE
ncbi:ATPase domain-containing protein [Halobiforma nitratireducens]|uniref:non-specific serine/threonine protein kinase n=1 Tax=Halobiforma nitratireducens JCM 10879 TaxID=1227454 RepID=M0M8U7_9EURY|nr:ATPase domain-containing protein [Halobiforma nitratireducens]EMA41019.1 circadian clock protein KaiC [Halobiforma nitratireducens JCM 10879]